MTAPQTVEPRSATAPRTPPRALISLFWRLHRGLVRVSGGRVGLRHPESGRTMGMLRLTTIGRRSGTARTVILGYVPAGDGFATLAMNGWGAADPAWWLNLQAAPDATVDLGAGPIRVRARAAEGAERDGLWTSIAQHPGWGADIDALAGRRPRETAVVVLERAVPAVETAR
jgi:deazaflavin-dependent oxidoreductase (nitroreductase family)